MSVYIQDSKQKQAVPDAETLHDLLATQFAGKTVTIIEVMADKQTIHTDICVRRSFPDITVIDAFSQQAIDIHTAFNFSIAPRKAA